jgi:tetratricopeptide (TPR) repeat protein
MAFEDMRWADDGLLDFVEYLLDWSAQHRIFILTFARPELTERRPGWPVGRRGATTRYLEPLGDAAMNALLDSVATLPEAANRKIIARAEGIPLYAIETLRALAHRGALQNRDDTLVLVSDLGELDVPPSLTSLLGARLDALEADERDLVKSMAVFGGSFPPAAVQAVAGVEPVRAETLLASLVRKQMLTVRADPLSPDRGQYRFAQTMLRTVAYEMLSRRERKARHLAAGQYLSGAFANEGEDVAEVVAAHYLEAYRCATNDADAEQLRGEAVTALRRGAARAAALGAPQAAEHAYRSAIELAVADEERIGLIESAANMALLDGRYETSLELFGDVTAKLENLGRERDAARLGPRIGQALFRAGRPLEMIERLRQGLSVLGSNSEDADVARMNVELGVALLSGGQVREAFEPLERALEVAQALDLPDVLAGALTYKAHMCDAVGRAQEARILFDGAIDLCRRHELTDQLYFAQVNSGDFLRRLDLPGWTERTDEALSTARRIGSRHYESLAASNLMRGWEYAGKWDEVERLGRELLGQSGDRPGVPSS